MDEEKLLALITKMYADFKESQNEMYTDLKGAQDKMYADFKESQNEMYTDLKDAHDKMYADLKGAQDDLKSSQDKMYADLKGAQDKMYDEMQEGFKTVDTRLTSVEAKLSVLETDVSVLKEDVGILKGNVVRIEVEHGQKLAALFDGYVQNSEKLDRIEAEVTRHEEFIIKRLK